MAKEQVELTRDDWLALFAFLKAANDVRSLMVRTTKKGKAQIAVTAAEVEAWLDTDVPADVWVKLGALMAGTTDKEQAP